MIRPGTFLAGSFLAVARPTFIVQVCDRKDDLGISIDLDIVFANAAGELFTRQGVVNVSFVGPKRYAGSDEPAGNDLTVWHAALFAFISGPLETKIP